MSNHLHYKIYKPYGMLSQFSPEAGHAVLGDLMTFRKDVYPVGRLDADSEGLLILSSDPGITNRLLDPSNAHWRTYYAQVEGIPDEKALEKLKQSVEIKVNGASYRTMPCKVEIIDEPILPERNPPIRERKSIPTTWLKLDLREGKNRQVRKMTAAVGFPTLRLVRWSIGKLEMGEMRSGEVKELNYDDLKLLFG